MGNGSDGSMSEMNINKYQWTVMCLASATRDDKRLSGAARAGWQSMDLLKHYQLSPSQMVEQFQKRLSLFTKGHDKPIIFEPGKLYDFSAEIEVYGAIVDALREV